MQVVVNFHFWSSLDSLSIRMNVENAAAAILRRGVDLDSKTRYTEALVCYQEGLQLLVDSMKNESGPKRNYLRSKIEEYMSRAEKVKDIISQLKEQGKYHEQITIENNSTGHSYDVIFNRFLDVDVISVKIEDPYIRAFHQCQNLVMFFELLVRKCTNLRDISLVTTQEKNSEQQVWLSEMKQNLLTYNVNFTVSYSSTLHDRQIILSNGWIIKIGRGLDYFKKAVGRFSLGIFDYNLRQCHETTIDVFHQNNVKQSFG